MQNSKIMTRKSAIIIVLLIAVGLTTSVLEATGKNGSLKNNSDLKTPQTKIMSSPNIGVSLLIQSLELSTTAAN